MYSKKIIDNDQKIKEVKRIFVECEIPEIIKAEIQKYTQKAFDSLVEINIKSDKKNYLKSFGESLMNRNV